MTSIERDRILSLSPSTAYALELEAPSPRMVMRRRALTHLGFLFGAAIMLLTILVAVFAPLLTSYDPYAQELSQRLIPPVWAAKGSWAHLFGTDGLGRDYLTRLMYGARISLIIGFGAATIAGIIGTSLGLIGGYFGGKVDAVVMYLVNVKLALPGILVALSLIEVFGGSVLSVTLILGVLFWDRFVVVTRSVTQQTRVADYVTAAEAVGASRWRIIVGEVLPNVLNHIIVIASLEMAVAILVEAALSFLGLGIRPPTPSWGLMVSEGRNFMFFQPYLVAIPGIAIFVLVIAINMLGDGIRDITAPEGRN
ncbi:MAG TPA: ABC transporter permease [Stellaceae bacterium]|jgi:peptide/nickel transport system permease protein|nr:ABC transporter permease [Stellaceae bacterium]